MIVEKLTLFDFTINSEVSILFQCKFLFQTLDFNDTLVYYESVVLTKFNTHASEFLFCICVAFLLLLRFNNDFLYDCRVR